MSECCGVSAAESLASPPASSRARAAFGWLLPTGVFALIPKCPACLAAYVALCTGCGISISTASVMRTSLIAACAASIAYVTLRQVNRTRGWRLFRRVAAAAPIL